MALLPKEALLGDRLVLENLCRTRTELVQQVEPDWVTFPPAASAQRKMLPSVLSSIPPSLPSSCSRTDKRIDPGSFSQESSVSSTLDTRVLGLFAPRTALEQVQSLTQHRFIQIERSSVRFGLVHFVDNPLSVAHELIGKSVTRSGFIARWTLVLAMSLVRTSFL